MMQDKSGNTDQMAAAGARTPSTVGGSEWRVTVGEGSSVKVKTASGWIGRRSWDGLVEFGRKLWKIGADEPRKVVHGLKVGLALSLVSLFYYARPLYNGFGSSAMWAVMTVVVVFEYTVGGCLYKGINRAIATLSAGVLAVGVHWLATKSGQKLEPLILSASVFLLASAATFSRFIPTVKARFDYGVTIFILTFSLVAVSGYRVDQLIDLAQQRISTIAIGIGITIIICVLVCPVWSGQELHHLISRNMAKLADSLHGCVEDYFDKNEEKELSSLSSSSSKISEGFKCVLNSKATEDSHANLARWEPPHGRFGFRHPWKQYLKVGAALRYCAYCVEALHGCINSEFQAPECLKKHLRDACMNLSSSASKVLKELSCSISQSKRSSRIDFLVGELHSSVQELQNALTSLPHQLTQITPSLSTESTEENTKKAPLALMDVMPLMTMASLLMEIAERIQGVVEAVDTLAKLARFKPVGSDKHSSSKVQAEEIEPKVLQEQV